MINKIQNTTVKISIKKDVHNNFGSGTIFKKNGNYYVITAEHCIFGKKDQREKFNNVTMEHIAIEYRHSFDNTPIFLTVNSIIESDETNDYAILQIAPPPIEFEFDSINFGFFANANAKECIFRGYAKVHSDTPRTYKCTCKEKSNNKLLFQLKDITSNQAIDTGSEILGGISGSGIFYSGNGNNTLIGIVTELRDELGTYDDFYSLSVSGINFLSEKVKPIKDSDILVKDIGLHNESILKAIQTEINVGDSTIKINRQEIVAQIKDAIANNTHLIISGEGGCGKTAVLKDFYYNRNNLHVCIFKATQLNVQNINEAFRFSHIFSFTQFLDVYRDENTKIFVIDSAEKLAELDNLSILLNFVNELKDSGWTFIFTTRNYYLDDLKFHIKHTYQLSYKEISIPLLNEEELQELAKNYKFSLPDNSKFKERLNNLFYLNEYIQEYTTIDQKGSFKSFINLIWKKRIQNSSFQANNLHIERERIFIEIVKKRCQTGLFYITSENLSNTALSALQKDEILGYDDTYGGYFITHDIYEEWALDKIIDRCFANYSEVEAFFENLGSSLPMRRAFRLWLSKQLSESIKPIEDFIADIMTNTNLSSYWIDEFFVSILLSDYSAEFIGQFEEVIISNEFKLLNRMLFLLRIACKEIYTIDGFDTEGYLLTRPKGKGWEVIIGLIYKHREIYFVNNLKLIFPVLTDWVNKNQNGVTTRYAGLLALSLLEREKTTDMHYSFAKNVEKNIQKIIYNSSASIQQELQTIFEEVLRNKRINYNDHYANLCSKILEKPNEAIGVIYQFPSYIIQLCNLFWKKERKKNRESWAERNDMEDKYGVINNHRLSYFPASAYQTPIYLLLLYSFDETLDFVIDFTNYAIENYRVSDYGIEDVKEVTLHINSKTYKQYLCWAFWGMYRGLGSPVVPYLLQSIHMALEKVLLEKIQSEDNNNLEDKLVYILTKSKSASLTSIVCSIILANPDKLSRVALILFRTIEFFNMDSIRCMNEFQVLIPMMPNKENYAKERSETKKDKHRNLNLESLFINYQFFCSKEFTTDENEKFIEFLYVIIDQHKSEIKSKPIEIQKNLGILLARIDGRTMNPTIKKHDELSYIVEFKPTLPPDLKKYSEEAVKESLSFFEYSSLKLWANYKGEGNTEKAATYPKYEDNPLLALAEMKDFLEKASKGTINLLLIDTYTPAFVSAALIKFYSEKLTSEDLDLCKKIIIEHIMSIFQDNYGYQISDGFEVCVHVIPKLMSLYPDEVQLFITILLFTLFDSSSIGAYKRICDYAIETIHEGNMWNNHIDSTNFILNAYIKIKPAFNQLFQKARFPNNKLSKQEKFAKIEEDLEGIDYTNISIELENINKLSLEDLEIVFKLIPNDTLDEKHLSILSQILSILPNLLSKKDEEEKYHNIYTLRLSLFQKFASFILNRNKNEIQDYLNYFLLKFGSNEGTNQLISEIILEENTLCKKEQFWFIWNFFYPYIIRLNPQQLETKNIIVDYMLAWKYWGERQEEWHSLEKDNLLFYANISKDFGHCPAVIYAISRVLNTIGKRFIYEGINWIYNVINLNKELQLDEFESNTIFYLEKIMRKFIFENKDKIKREIRLKEQVITILDFIIERASINGYLLRESIL